jgi:hypothetical protein
VFGCGGDWDAVVMVRPQRVFLSHTFGVAVAAGGPVVRGRSGGSSVPGRECHQ